MDLNSIQRDVASRMDKTVEYLDRELRGMRTGRANTALLEYIKVEYYGSSTDLRELAAINVAEATQLVVKPFDPAAKNDILKAIEATDLGLNPQVDGQQLRINVPSPSTERRKQLIAQVRKMGEEAKVAVRNERRDGMKAIDAAADADKLPDDEVSRAKDALEGVTKKHVGTIDEHVAKKVAEIEDV